MKTRDGAAYLKNFHLSFDDPRSGVRYYSFDWGSVHFVALDRELYHGDSGGDEAEQKAWLERDLSATTLGRKVVFLHRPPTAPPDTAATARYAGTSSPSLFATK